ncbi:MAG TPA: fatty acid desaturase [Thermoanaerobaculia bacterium]|nr:fatty acid desaturase [Thermoanaerobaculia bacterium]
MLPTIDYREVGRHYDERDAQVVFQGHVYDVTEFLRLHPGGRSILVPALGTDITDTLESLHPGYVGRLFGTEATRQQYGIRLIGVLADDENTDQNKSGLYDWQSRRAYRRPDPLADELRRAVYGYLREHKLPWKKRLPAAWSLLIFFYALYASAMYFAFFRGSTLAALLLGPIITFAAVNVAHTVMHGGFTDSKVINLLGRTIWDFVGYSSRCWDVEHQSHHQAPHSMIDLQTAGATVVRFFEHQEYRPYHRYQMFYIWFVFILYSPNSWVVHSYNTLVRYKCVPLREKIGHVIAKSVGFVFPITASFVLLDFRIAFLNLFLFAISKSYFSLFTLFIQHEDSYLDEDADEPWSIRQIGTSATWYTNDLLQWFLGYFNHHTEHHLFPGLNPALYPKIRPIVQAICEKNGVRYKHISLWELISSQVSAWRKFATGWTRDADALNAARRDDVPTLRSAQA